MTQECSNEELIELARKGDIEAKDKFFEKNRPFIFYMANKFRDIGMEYDDIISLASIGLVKAYNTYDASKGFKFLALATMCMQNEILKEFRRFKRKFGYDPISLDETYYSNEDGKSLSYIDTLVDESMGAEEKVIIKETSDNLIKVINKLDDYDRKIIKLYYFDKKAMHVIGKEMGCSQVQVSRLNARILKKLRVLMEDY